jgi:hypothetical protein
MSNSNSKSNFNFSNLNKLLGNNNKNKTLEIQALHEKIKNLEEKKRGLLIVIILTQSLIDSHKRLFNLGNKSYSNKIEKNKTKILTTQSKIDDIDEKINKLFNNIINKEVEKRLS